MGKDINDSMAREEAAFEAAERADEWPDDDDGVVLSNSHEWSARFE